MALSLVQNHFGSRSNATYFYAIREVVSMRKLKKYKPTRFMQRPRTTIRTPPIMR